MTNPMMSVNSLLTSGQPRVPMVPSPFGPPIVDRDVLSSSIAPTDPSQFCVPSQFGSSGPPNANMPNPLSGHFYSGWGILPPEPIKTVTTRNEMFERHHAARTEMEMYSLYQQRRMERVNPKGLSGLGIPLFYGSSCLGGPAGFQGRSTLPASDVHLHRSTFRHLQGNPILLATRPHFTECWGQKYRVRRGSVYQKPPESDTESFKSQAEEKSSGQMSAVPYEEDEYIKDPDSEVDNQQKLRVTDGKPNTVLANPHGELQPHQRKPSSLEVKPWDDGKGKPSEQECEGCDAKNGVCLPVSIPPLPGIQEPVALRENHSLSDIQKWTVEDVYNFIRSLPGCSDYAQVFKDHAIDGETLPLLTEQHLRGTMGLKLGPALKIQSQVSQHMGNMFCKKLPSLPTHAWQAFDQSADAAPLLDVSSWSDSLSIPGSQDIMSPKRTEQDVMRN
ncbi:sterile alpha motif domain-containing protein 7 [Arvicanthis niloticus]|uniref:sterile alpha motif domain-containing protein 7 n=1 Tax=Arvicanthis niloticus TaxID=61156 RepID=UPI0014863521|nr:sterile alpha motif domain-containing protein 7 [Arvicanthis niloticus]XP_034356074.1 sterile alpha motif domain-containing protein 7 [Arvicanthis niloticus]XP_034356075.1 sterile alpha motif domain-containing protein 7 [Arvicanthis niloticus]XP_034356076.1 sterile alpha motif domain-containing protein 7 [Arvicanthis niloticus]XP_034356077.1 sterile alpha motif domain-containing protein 7 [Arvicanthis niloticus]